MRNIFLAFLGAAILVGCSGPKPSRPDNPVVRGVHYVGLVVSDVEKASEFYQQSTNVVESQSSEFDSDPVIDALADRSGVKVKTRLLSSVNANVRLMEFENSSPEAKAAEPVEINGPGIAHLAFQVAKTTGVYERFLGAGGNYIGDREIQLNPRTNVAYAYAHDHDNAIIEIEEVDVAALNLPKPPKNNYRIRHISLASPDIERSAKFYASLLQVTNGRRGGPSSGVGTDKVTGKKDSELLFAWFQVRNLELEVIQYASHPTKLPEKPRPLDASGFNMVVFDVSDMAAARKLLVASGGTVVLENQTLDGADVMFARDPDGNLLGFQQLTKDDPLSALNFKNNGLE